MSAGRSNEPVGYNERWESIGEGFDYKMGRM